MKSLVTLSALLMTAVTAIAQPLAQEQFIIGPAGVGYTEGMQMTHVAQTNPIATSPIKGWFSTFDNRDADGIAQRYLKEGSRFVPFYVTATGLHSGNLVTSGGKLLVASGGLSYYAQINTALDGPLAAYSTTGTLIDKDGTTLYISFLYKLTNLNVGPNHNLISFIDGVNTSREFDNYLQAYVRNYTGRYTFGQEWGTDTLSGLIPIDTETHLVVMKIEYKDGDDTLHVFVDPDGSMSEAQNTPQLANSSRDMTFNALRIVAQQATANTTGMMFDELRFGSTWESVVPQYVLRSTADFGGNFGWRQDIGFSYTGFYPFVYLFDAANWIYVFPGSTEASGYFLYDFGREQFGYSGTAFYPNYVKLPADDTYVHLGAKVVEF
ncbi:MAG: hypothetical protein SFY80_16910 [Verrucomicrobiota bacterium]|nr:hypothetical protein [Verrucomicrobiota bacterium]